MNLYTVYRDKYEQNESSNECLVWILFVRIKELIFWVLFGFNEVISFIVVNKATK